MILQNTLNGHMKAKRFLSAVDLSKGPILVSVQTILRIVAVDWSSPKREGKEYMYYTTQWEAKNWLGNTIRCTHEAEGKYTQQTKEIVTRLNRETGEHMQDYHMGTPRITYTIPWAADIIRLSSQSVYSLMQ
ncbi:MAG: hypothetical protein WB587_04495 [Nitrososphaeraceae archaeon]